MKEDLETAYLFAHGIQGSPAQFIFLTERLPVPLPAAGIIGFPQRGRNGSRIP